MFRRILTLNHHFNEDIKAKSIEDITRGVNVFREEVICLKATFWKKPKKNFFKKNVSIDQLYWSKNLILSTSHRFYAMLTPLLKVIQEIHEKTRFTGGVRYQFGISTKKDDLKCCIY